MRYYIKARDMRLAGILDWEDKVLAMLNPQLDRRDLEVVSALVADAGLDTEHDRVERFKMITGKSQAPYYRYRKVLAGSRGIR